MLIGLMYWLVKLELLDVIMLLLKLIVVVLDILVKFKLIIVVKDNVLVNFENLFILLFFVLRKLLWK